MTRTRTTTPEPEPQDQDQDQAKALVAQEPVQDARMVAFGRVQRALEARSDALMAVLPSKVGVDRFMRVALGAMSRTPLLFECTTESVVKAMLDAAELGLEPSGLLGQAYLVPFRNRVKVAHPTNPAVTVEQWQYEAQLIVGYRGLVDIMLRSDQVSSVEARAVRARDVFALSYGTTPGIHHVPYIPGVMGAPAAGAEGAPEDGAGPYTAFYAVITLKDGTKVIDVMSNAEVQAVRARSRAKDSGPWVSDYAEMGRKTVTRRASKYGPASIIDMRLAEALDREDRAQFGTSADPAQAAVQVATGPQAALAAAAESLRQGATGQEAPQPVLDAPGGPQAPAAEPVAQDATQADPGPSTGKGDGSFTASPAIGVKVGGKATGKAGPARCAVVSSNGVGCELPADHTTPHQGDGQSWDWDPQPVQPSDDRMVACEAPSPYGDGDVCLMPKGHRGAHRSTGGTW